MSQRGIYEIKNIHQGGNLEIGSNVSIEPFSSIICKNHIKIGDNTVIAPGAVIVDFDHYTGPQIGKTWDDGKMGEVIIGKDCWIGANACVLKNVTLGDGCVVGAGAVVTKSFPKGSVIVGNPAKLYKKR